MADKRRINVNLVELSAAFGINFPDQDAYFGLKTGDVVWITDETHRELEKLWEKIPDISDPPAALDALISQRADMAEWQQEELRDDARVDGSPI